MKTITILIFTLIFNACGTSKAVSNVTSNTQNTQNMESKIVQDGLKIEYRASTRGFFKKIILENKTISVQNHHSSKAIVTACDTEEWNTLEKMVSDFNLKSMSAIEAPSKAHQYDGAQIAHFTITKNGEANSVPPFDAGNPNKEIEAIVNFVINMDKSTAKKK